MTERETIYYKRLRHAGYTVRLIPAPPIRREVRK